MNKGLTIVLNNTYYITKQHNPLGCQVLSYVSTYPHKEEEKRKRKARLKIKTQKVGKSGNPTI